jgi:DNA-binding transcriptional MocR family regulator
MSRDMTDRAFALILKPATRKLTLLVLADCHNHLTGRCNPSIKFIADHTGLNRKSVIESLADLESRGLISVARGHSNSYKLNLSQESKVSTEIGTELEMNLGPENGTCLVPKTGLTWSRKRDTNRELTGKEPFMPEAAPKTKTKTKTKTKAKTQSKKRSPETPMPEGFGISERVRDWATKNNHRNLDTHHENFVLAARSRGYKYVDWDAAFQRAIRDNWAKVTTKTTEVTF